jgi:signal recognition particle subunit SRP72
VTSRDTTQQSRLHRYVVPFRRGKSRPRGSNGYAQYKVAQDPNHHAFSPAVKMSTPTASLTALLRGTTIEDHDEVLKAANAVLKASKGDQDALHTRVVALLKLDRFDDALRALDDGGDRLAERCVLEKAYALYKTGKLEEAEKLVEGAQKRGLKHVAAQVAYRAEKFEDAARLYKDLSAQSAAIEGEENDLRINSSATDAQLEWQGKGDKVDPSRKKPSSEDLEAFETSYNAACGYIARGDFTAGGFLLKKAKDLCESLEELSDDEKKAEVLPIMVQQAYVLTKLGKLEEAEALQSMINIAEYVFDTYRLLSLLTNIVFPNPRLE